MKKCKWCKRKLNKLTPSLRKRKSKFCNSRHGEYYKKKNEQTNSQ